MVGRQWSVVCISGISPLGASRSGVLYQTKHSHIVNKVGYNGTGKAEKLKQVTKPRRYNYQESSINTKV